MLHDWPDDKCLEILARIKAAMRPGYSKLLIHEIVLSLDSSLYGCALDICMMVLNSARERTEEQWTRVLGKAGFDKVKFHSMKGVREQLIEVEI